MSDEESFVILGSSPMPSLETDGSNGQKSSKHSSLQSDTPGSSFSSLKNSQIKELQSAREISTQTPTPPAAMEEGSTSSAVNTTSNVMEQSAKTSISEKIATNVMEQSAESKLWSIPLIPTAQSVMQQSAESKLWSRPPVEAKDTVESLSLEDCALKSPLQQSVTEGITVKEGENLQSSLKKVTISAPSSLNTPHITPNGFKPRVNESSLPKTPSLDNNLASSFIMGEVNADVLKSSVYSQFPSISMEACPEDVVKLQNMFTEYMELKTTLQKVNNTMKLFYNNSMQWKDKMNLMENHYKQQLNDCQDQIEMLRKENQNLKQCFEAQIEQTKALDVARQKDREETIQEISEKSALLENMRAQIVKLEQKQLSTFEFIPKKQTDKTKENFDEYYVTRSDHELKIKDFERQLSELLASNLDSKDIEKQYIDELNCLKVNLTAAEEIIKQHRAEIAELRALDLDKQTKIEELEKSNNELCAANSEQNERIVVLEQQNEVHRKDFEMERDSRQTVVGEKQQILQDLRALQKKNQDLIVDRQSLVESYERKISSVSSLGTHASYVASAAAAQTYIDNPQRPIRVLTPQSEHSKSASPPSSIYRCPICNKPFKSLNVLQSHVNDCIDKN